MVIVWTFLQSPQKCGIFDIEKTSLNLMTHQLESLSKYSLKKNKNLARKYFASCGWMTFIVHSDYIKALKKNVDGSIRYAYFNKFQWMKGEEMCNNFNKKIISVRYSFNAVQQILRTLTELATVNSLIKNVHESLFPSYALKTVKILS